jgi:hypothetical protein
MAAGFELLLSTSTAFAGPDGGASGASYATNFNLTESPISEGGAWHHNGLDWSLVDTSGGFAFGTQTGSGGFDDSYAYLSGFAPDQSASAVVHRDPAINPSTTHEVEILLRWVDSAHVARGYECNFAWDGAYAEIVRWNGAKSDFSILVSGEVPGGLKEGDVVSAQIAGHVITTFVNGVQIASATDSTWTDGNPGMGFWRGAPSGPATDLCFTSYAATSAGAAQSVPALPPTYSLLLAGLLLAASGPLLRGEAMGGRASTGSPGPSTKPS